jgi:hypothetical protein
MPDEKRAQLTDLKRDHLIEQVCVQEMRKKLYLFTIFFSNVDLATRSLSGNGPAIVPASNKMTQSLLAAFRTDWNQMTRRSL